MIKTHAVTFLCEVDVHKAIQELADKNYEGKFSVALREILKEWNKK